MFRQVKGEGLNVGCVLTWGPGFDHQRQFFEPTADKLSEPLTLLKYDIEVSGFGSQALGHVCLLNLKDQIYPGANGAARAGRRGRCPCCAGRRRRAASAATRTRAAGCRSMPAAATTRLLEQLDTNKDGRLDCRRKPRDGLLPEPFAGIDADRDGVLSEAEMKSEPRPRGRPAAEPGDPRAERRRRAGDLRHGRAWRRRLHQRDGHGSHPRVERVVSPDELRASA